MGFEFRRGHKVIIFMFLQGQRRSPMETAINFVALLVTVSRASNEMGVATLLTLLQICVAYASQSSDVPPATKLPPSCGGPHKIPPLADTKWRLQHVSVFIRHGDRMRCGFKPCWKDDAAEYACDLTRTGRASGHTTEQGHVYKPVFPVDGHGQGVLPGRCELGQLTPRGRAQHLERGHMLREAYRGFLPKQYEPEVKPNPPRPNLPSFAACWRFSFQLVERGIETLTSTFCSRPSTSGPTTSHALNSRGKRY